MLKIENVEVMGWDHAIRGMRNPMNSWEKSDSACCTFQQSCIACPANTTEGCPLPGCDPMVIGPNDHQLMMNLAHGGPVHAKYRRMITVYLDITAPLYWWKEFDTYKVGTVANSCSTMHKIHAKEFTLEDFSCEHLIDDEAFAFPLGEGWRGLSAIELFNVNIEALNNARKRYLETMNKPMKDNTKRSEVAKKYWWQMIQLLPTSYNQKRTVMLNYEVLVNIYESRRHHKLDEWHTFCDWIESLPYSELIIGEREEA
jgi:hypothetical protein